MKHYKNLLRRYNLSADTLSLLERNKNNNPYKSTWLELNKTGVLGARVDCHEVPLTKKTVPNHVCYTVGKRRWAFNREWKEKQIERTLSYVNSIKATRKDKCIIIGNGPSLKKIDLLLLKDQDVFVCNLSLIHISEPTRPY